MTRRLKIHPHLFKDIMNGSKTIEVRKINKDGLEYGDIITYTDLDDNYIGSCRVGIKWTGTPKEIQNLLWVKEHNKTWQFIEDNYKNEKKLVAYEIQNPRERIGGEINDY